jgi:hypothetical protein
MIEDGGADRLTKTFTSGGWKESRWAFEGLLGQDWWIDIVHCCSRFVQFGLVTMCDLAFHGLEQRLVLLVQ